MKKKLIGLLLLLLTGCAAAGCGSIKSDASYDYNFTYSYNKGYVSVAADEDMNIDGKLDEAVWKNSNWFSNTKYGATVRTATYFTEKGLYIASAITDNMIFYNNGYNFTADSCMDYHIIDDTVTAYDFKDYTRIAVNCAGEVYRYTPTVVLAGATVQGGGVNTGASEGMTVELFIEWSKLGCESPPPYVRIVPRYYRVSTYGTSVSGTWVYASRGSLANIYSYYKFNGNGYMQQDEPSAYLGDSAAGAAKTNGWDLSEYENSGRVSCKVQYDQWIFVKEAYSSRYVFSVVATSSGAIVNTTPMFGVLSGYLNDTGYFSSFLIDGRSDYLSSGRVQCKTRTVDASNANVFGNVLYDDYGKGGENFRKGLKITVIKDGGTFYYLIGDKVVAVEENSNLRGRTSCGLFSLNSAAVFANCKYTDYENDEAGFKEYLAKYACTVSVESGITGGSLSVSAPGVALGGDVDITVTNQAGYRLKSFTVNGEDITDELNRDMSKGVYTLRGLKSSVIIGAQFETTPNYQVSGTVDISGSTSRNKTGIRVIAEDQAAHSAVYTVNPNNAGRYTLRLPKGTYKIYYELEGCRKAQQTVTVDGNTQAENIVLAVGTVGGSANGMNSMNGWNYENEENGVVTTGSSVSESYIMFTDVVLENYILTAVISDVGHGDDNPGAGFIVAADNYSGLAIMLINNQIRVMPVGKFSQRKNYSVNLNFSVVNAPVEFTVIRKGIEYYVYVNGTFVLHVRNDYITDAAGIGLYKYANTEIMYSNYSYTGDSAEIEKFMQKHN